MVYDRDRFVTVLFGGTANGTIEDETWLWDIYSIHFTQQPSAQSVNVGATATFSVAANSGPIALKYAWRKNGTPLTDGGFISGAETPTLTINSLTANDAGSYDVEVSHACETVASQAVALTVNSSAAASEPPGAGSPSAPGLSGAPCGTCGGGTAAMIPLSLMGWTLARTRTGNRRRKMVMTCRRNMDNLRND